MELTDGRPARAGDLGRPAIPEEVALSTESAPAGSTAGLGSADVAVVALVAILVALQYVDVQLQFPGLASRRLAVIISCQGVIGAIQVVHSVRRLRAVRDRIWPFSLAAQAVLTFAPAVVFDMYWGAVADLFIASCLVLLRRRFAWSILAAIEVVTLVLGRHGYGAAEVIYLLSANLTGALPVWGLTRLGDVIGELALSRRLAAQLAVDHERRRFSRDLHDLLGYTLSAITLKGELAERLAGVDDAHARQELTDVVGLAREAALDVQAIARGERSITLMGQLDSARALVASAGVDLAVDATVDTLPGIVDAVLATVVREGVTNLLRHGRTEHAQITVASSPTNARVEICNDGVPPADDGPLIRGHGGLDNLQSRLTTVGGTLDAAVRADGWFVLRADVPLGG